MRFVDVYKKLETTSTILVGTTTLIVFSTFADCTLAQIDADTTLGKDSSQVTPNVTIKGNSAIRIDGGAKRGGNLFHSFEKFNVDDGQHVYFANPDEVQNILSRVSGSTVSEINGTVGVLGSANLFLINPNGIVFGPNAALDVSGSFLASTADSFVFNNGFQFSATNLNAPPLLTVNVPIGLQFNGSANSIVNQSTALNNNGLRVQPGNTLALVGGDVSLQGGALIATDGRIEIGSVAKRSLVKLLPTETGWTLNYQQVQNFLDIELGENSPNNPSFIGAFNDFESFNSPSGEVRMQGRNITLADRSFVVANKVVKANASGTLSIVDSAGIFNEAVSTQDGGDVIINAEKLTLRRGGFITTAVTGIQEEDLTITPASGNGGDILVNAESVELTDESSDLLSFTEGIGDAGNIRIDTKRLAVKNGALISAGSNGFNANGQPLRTGRGGKIEIVDAESVEVLDNSSISSQTQSLGDDAGNLRVETKNLVVQNEAFVSAATFGTGDGGSVTVHAESVKLSGASDEGRSGLFTSPIEGSGDGGSLKVFTDELIIRDGATISVSNSQSRNRLSPGSGAPGDLSIEADTILLDKGIIEANTAGDAQGNIILDADNIVLRDRSQIITDSQSTDGGNITIDTNTLVALDNSDITANAQEGTGGRVVIDAKGIFGIQARDEQTPESDITVSSELGPEFSGVVEINSLDADPSQSLVELPQEVVNVARLIDQNVCSAGKGSDFIVTGRGGLPSSPYTALDSNAIQVDWVALKPESEVERQEDNETEKRGDEETSDLQSSTPNQIVEAQGWIVNDRGKVILTARAPDITPHSSWQKPVECNQG